MSNHNPNFVPTKVSDLKPGDMVDLAHDIIADPYGDSHVFECEYAVVCGLEIETPECVRVDIEGVDSFGFPPLHLVRVYGHDEGYDPC